MRRWKWQTGVAFGVFAALLAMVIGVFNPAALSAQNAGIGWTVQYFNNTNLQLPAVLTTNAPNGPNFTLGTGSPDPSVQAEDWSARYTATQIFNAGQYQFTIGSDDGVRFFIDNVLVLDRFFGRVFQPEPLTVTLTAGPHTLVVEYFDDIDQATLLFQYVQIGGTFPTPTGVFGTFVPPVFGPTPSAAPPTRTPLPAIPPGALTGSVVRASILLVRSAPYLGAPVAGRVRRGETYAVIGRDEDARWFLLQLGGYQGWVWGYYLFINGNEFNAPVASSFVTLGNPAALTGVVMQTQATLRLRASPNAASEQIGRIPWGDVLPVTGRSADGGWYQTVFRGTTGWVAIQFVNVIEGDVNTVPVNG